MNITFSLRIKMESQGLCTGVLVLCLFGLALTNPIPLDQKALTDATAAELRVLGIGSTESFKVN